ncbi:MAG TPA: hypothetical protein PK156_35810, partial [Polyangium sp.]|nr:hypothetical protein [Polyangium sp.]
ARAGTTHGIAEALLRAGVQAVVAYTRWPSPKVTATVTEALYESLFKHGPMEGNIAAAVSAVRRRLDTQVLTDSTDRRESASLVVYLAGRDPILFASATNVVNAKTTPPNTIPETPNPRPPQPDPKRPPTNPKHGTVRFDAHVQGRLVAIAALVAFALVASALVWRNQYLETITLPTTLPVSARPITPEPVPNPDPHPLVDLTAKTWGDGGTTFCTYLQDQKPPLGPSKCVPNTDPKLGSATPFDLVKLARTNLVLEIDSNGRATIRYWGQLETATKLRTNFKPFDLSNLEMVKEAAPLLFALAKVATDRAAYLGCVKMPQSNDPSLQLLGSFLRKMSKSPCRVTDDERLALARESTCADPADPMCTLYKYLYMDRLGVELKDPEISARAIDLEQTRHVEGNDLEVLLVNNARILSEQVDAATKQRAGTWLTSFRTPMMSACARVLSAPIAARVLTNASGDLKPIADLPPEVFNQCTDDLAKMKSYYDRGIARSFAEQFKEAAEDFHEAHKLDPANPLYRLHLARTWLLTKNPEEAYALLTKPIDLSKAEHDTKVGLEVLKVYAVKQLAQMGTSVVNGVPFTRDAVQVHLQKMAELCKQAPANIQVVPCQPPHLRQIFSPNADAKKMLDLVQHPPSVTTFRQLEHLFRIGR